MGKSANCLVVCLILRFAFLEVNKILLNLIVQKQFVETLIELIALYKSF